MFKSHSQCVLCTYLERKEKIIRITFEQKFNLEETPFPNKKGNKTIIQSEWKCKIKSPPQSTRFNISPSFKLNIVDYMIQISNIVCLYCTYYKYKFLCLAWLIIFLFPSSSSPPVLQLNEKLMSKRNGWKRFHHPYQTY